MAETKEDPWPYPKAFCRICQRGFRDRAQLIGHMFDRRHWKAPPPPDPAQAQQLMEALEAAAARQREDTRDDLA
jgi:hypothetical protein